MAPFDKLLAEAQKLGIPTNSNIYKPRSDAYSELQITDWELHRRIQEEKRNLREQKLWIVAIVSAVASVISALAAWAAVFHHP